MALLYRVRNVLGVVPSHRRPCWWPAGLLALMVPLAIWLTSLGLFRPGAAEVQAAETADAKPAAAAENRIQPLDLLMIRVLGTMLDQPIDGLFLVQPNGQVSLGPAYGRVEVKGLTIEGAEVAVHKKVGRDPEQTGCPSHGGRAGLEMAIGETADNALSHQPERSACDSGVGHDDRLSDRWRIRR